MRRYVCGRAIQNGMKHRTVFMFRAKPSKQNTGVHTSNLSFNCRFTFACSSLVITAAAVHMTQRKMFSYFPLLALFKRFRKILKSDY
jgi:hypothetical protein